MLQQEGIAAHAAQIPSPAFPDGLYYFHQPQVFFLLQNLQRFRRKIRRNDDLAENLRDRLRTARIQCTIHGNDPAKRRLFVRGIGFVPGGAQIVSLSHAARIHMLQNRQCRRFDFELRNQAGRSGQIQNVVVRKFLAMQLLEELLKISIQAGCLMRIFPVTQRLHEQFWKS